VAVRGRVVSLLEVGTGFHPELTGRENVFLNGAILGMTRGEVRQKFDEIVSFADVQRFIDTPVKHFSSGMYMRLAFSVAAHLESDILLVDEVLAVGDASFQKKCLAKMQNVAGKGRTVLFVSHNMSAVQSLCGRVIHLANGQIKGDGEPQHEINDYLSSATVSQMGHKRLKLGDALTLMNMSVSPNPVQSGNDVRFRFDLLANYPVQMTEAQLVLFALEGPRVGIVDLRPAGFPFTMKAGDCVGIEAILRSIPLVDHQYRVALWVDWGASASVVDVFNLTISPGQPKGLYAPYPPQARGLVEFKTECSAQQYRELSSIATG
jgi:lipopolysaccharide transport system ATP-binding protein